MIWHLLRLATTFLILLGIYFKLDFIFDNFENNLQRLSQTKSDKANNIAFSFCTDFYNLYQVAGCGDANVTRKICANKSQAECNEILFEATQTSSSLFSLIRNCNLITIFKIKHNSSHMLYVSNEQTSCKAMVSQKFSIIFIIQKLVAMIIFPLNRSSGFNLLPQKGELRNGLSSVSAGNKRHFPIALRAL